MSRSLDDETFSEVASLQARDQLERAYADAEEALERGHSALEESWTAKVRSQLSELLMLERRRRAASYVVVFFFYLLVLFLWFSFTAPEQFL